MEFYVSFARQEITSSGAQQFVHPSNATETFKVGRDTGAMLHGKVAKGLATYNLGIYGGVGQNTVRTTDNNALAARVTVNPFGEMAYSEADLDRARSLCCRSGAITTGTPWKDQRHRLREQQPRVRRLERLAREGCFGIRRS